MKHLIGIVITLFTFQSVVSQQWMTSLDMAKRMALSGDKMVLMVWEESVFTPYPAVVRNESGQKIIIKNMFDDEGVSELLWKYFVPVIVSEHLYGDLFSEIKGQRNSSYIDKFNDDGFKVMDPNGTILNTDPIENEYLDLNDFIAKYALNTSYLQQDLRNYRNQRDFYSAFYLAERYIDYATLVNAKATMDILDVSTIYLDEAKDFLENTVVKDKDVLIQRCQLLELKQFLIRARPRKVIRELEDMEEQGIESTNESFKAFLYYTAYLLINDEEESNLWKTKVSLVDLKKVQAIINSTINQRQ